METPKEVNHRTLVFGEIEETELLYLGFAEDVERSAHDEHGRVTGGIMEREIVAECLIPRNCRINLSTILRRWKEDRSVPFACYLKAVRDENRVQVAKTYPTDEAYRYRSWHARRKEKIAEGLAGGVAS